MNIYSRLHRFFVYLFFSFLFGCSTSTIGTNSQITSNALDQAQPTASLLINIYGNEYREYLFSLHKYELTEVNRGKVLELIEPGSVKYVTSSEEYHKILKTDSLSNTDIETKLEEIFAPYNMKYIDAIATDLFRQSSRLSFVPPEKYPLIGPGEKLIYPTKYSEYIIINRQFTHAIFHLLNAPLLIDFTEKLVRPFGRDTIIKERNDKGLMGRWDPAGKRIAYATTDDPCDSRDGSILVVRDIVKNDIVFSKDLKKFIIEIAWSPNGHHLAVLSEESSLIKTPIHLIMAHSGHPFYKRTYYFSLLDVRGEVIFRKKLDAIDNGNTGGSGSMVWVESKVGQSFQIRKTQDNSREQ